MRQEKNWLGLPPAKLYLDAEIPPNTRSRYRAVAEAIREAFRERIEHSDWMSHTRRDSAILKLDR